MERNMIRRFISLLLLTFIVCGLVMSDAQAKRFGGGRSFGVSKTTTTNQFSRTADTKPLNQMNQASRANKWLAPLAGLALGGILASLLMGNGFGTGILAWLAIGALVLLVMRWWRSRTQVATQLNSASDHTSYFSSTQARQAATYSPHASQLPVGFSPDDFIRDAKVQFVRLQTAYDTKNLADIREFTTPEVFAEIHMQLQERDSEQNQTEVVQLDADLLDVANESDVMMGAGVPNVTASVRFSGLIKENTEQAATFNEIWHFKKDIISSRWIVAGVQQN